MTEEFIPCTPMALPPELAEAAAQTAVEENPANAPVVQSMALGLAGFILPPQHLAVLTSKYWGNKGVRLTTNFMESTPVDLRNKILLYLNQWDEYCNAQFVYSTVDPMVRITRSGQGYWSYLGTDIKHIPKNQATMCLQGWTMSKPESEWLRVPTHEAGHTLGFPHEHMRRQIIQRIDPDKAIAYFRATQGWTAQMVYQQVLTPVEESALIGTPSADEESIMTYSFPGSITKDGKPIIGGTRITKSDAEFANRIYPETIIPKPEPKPEANGLRQFIDFAQKIVYVDLPNGWQVLKMVSSEGGLNVESVTLYCQLADELKAALPAAAPGAGPLGGIFGAVQTLIAALRSGDPKAIATAVRDILNIFIGDTGGISFAPTAVAAGFNWSVLISVLKRIIPILIDEFAK